MALTGKQKRFLRGLAHHLSPVVQVGDGGITDAVLSKLDAELENHELLKVKLGQGTPVSVKDAAPVLAERTKSEVAQIIGRTVVLYRPRSEEPTIQFPRGT